MAYFKYIPYADDDPEYIKEQEEGHKKISEQKQGCSYCVYFNYCHTTVWRKGQTCDLFKGIR